MAAQSAKALLQSWGWSPKDAPEQVIGTAKRFAKLGALPMGQRIVSLGIATQGVVESHLSEKGNEPTLDYLMRKIPGVDGYHDILIGIDRGYAFYEFLPLDWTHPAFVEYESVRQECKEYQAALIRTNANEPVLVFPSIRALSRFSSMGRGDKSHNPIYKALNNKGSGDRTHIHLALGSESEILTLRRRNEKESDTLDSDEDEGTSTWAGLAEHDTQAQEMARDMVYTAMQQGVTDISVIPGQNGRGLIYYRMNKKLTPPQHQHHIPAAQYVEMARFLMSKSGANPEASRLREPRDGQILFRHGNREVFIRASFIPAEKGGSSRESVSISLRLLPREEKRIMLDDLKMGDEVTEALRLAASYGEGVVLLSGPTNSGKSTTIAATLGEHYELFGDGEKRVSIEDPIERYMDFVTQFQVKSHWEDGFAKVFRAGLRHDPDLIFVGEIRDEETAEIASKAGSSGHLVVSTIHAKDAVMTYRAIANRLPKEKRFDLIESLLLIVAQRLVPEICQECGPVWKEPDKMTRDRFEKYCELNGVDETIPDQIPHENPKGCQHCKKGIKGIRPIHEIFWLTRTVKDLLLEMESSGFNRSKIQEFSSGSLLGDGLRLAHEGKIRIEDAMK